MIDEEIAGNFGQISKRIVKLLKNYLVNILVQFVRVFVVNQLTPWSYHLPSLGGFRWKFKTLLIFVLQNFRKKILKEFRFRLLKKTLRKSLQKLQRNPTRDFSYEIPFEKTVAFFRFRETFNASTNSYINPGIYIF